MQKCDAFLLGLFSLLCDTIVRVYESWIELDKMIILVDIKFDCGFQSSITGLSLGELIYASQESAFCLLGFLLGPLGKKWYDHFAFREPAFFFCIDILLLSTCF